MFGGSRLLPGGVLGRSSFKRMWGGVLLSRVGDQFTVVALMWFVLELAGPGAAGLVLASFGLPVLVSGPVAGRFLDRFQPRVVMSLDNLFRAAFIALVPALHWAGILQIWQLCAIAFACGLLSPATEVGERTLVPELVPDGELEEANALVSANWEVAALVGPLGAGVFIVLIGPTTTLFVDSVSFLAISGIMLTMPSMSRGRPEGHSELAPGAFGRALKETFEGFALLVEMRAVGLLTLGSLVVLFLEGVREVLIPVYGREVLGAGASGYGAMISTIAAGSLLGLLILAPLARKVAPGVALAGVLALGGLLFAPLAFVGSLPAALVVVFAAGFALAPFYVISRSASQRLVPERLRGRVFGAGASLGAAGFPLGSAAGGFLLTGLSTETVILLSSVLMAALGITMLTLRKPPDPGTPPSAEDDLETEAKMNG